MAPARSSRSLPGLALLLALGGCFVFGLQLSAFALGGASTFDAAARSLAQRKLVKEEALRAASNLGRPGLHHGAAAAASGAGVTQAAATAAGLTGAVVGALVGVGATAAVARHAYRLRRARTAARVSPNAPSLIQVLEQKGLLSTAERLKLLSKAEAAGLGVATVEELGLLVLAEDLGLLSLAETVVTDSSTVGKLLAGSAVLAVATYIDITLEDFGIVQWILAGALGAPAAALFVAALVIFGLTSGTRRTVDIDQVDTFYTYQPTGTLGDFKENTVKESVTLIDILEQKKLLSFLENNRLLSLAASLVNRPLTLTENLGVLSTLERSGILSQVEGTVTETYGAAGYGAIGTLFLIAGLLVQLLIPGSTIFAVLVALPGLAAIAFALALGIIQAPKRFAR